MNTEITDTIGFESASGWLGYDAECPWCARGARTFGPLLATRGVRLVPLRAPWVRERLGLTAGTRPEEMVLLTSDGDVAGGADVIIALAGRFWWAWPLHLAARIPAIRALLGAGYRWIAARRPCLNGACRVETRPDPALSVQLALSCRLSTHERGVSLSRAGLRVRRLERKPTMKTVSPVVFRCWFWLHYLMAALFRRRRAGGKPSPRRRHRAATVFLELP